MELPVVCFYENFGYSVSIYEKYDKIGGILSHGIPEYRLDNEILDKWINGILSLGMQIEYQKELGKDFNLSDLEQDYDAIFLSFGANICSDIGCDGEDLTGVYGGNELLEAADHPDYMDKAVAVVGGGNVAIDCATVIKKLGAKSVKVIYRRSEDQMPAEKKEIEYAKKEGVEFLFQTNILKIIGDKKVERIECIKTELQSVGIDSMNARKTKPINIPDTNYTLDVDYVIKAIGSKADQDIIKSLGLQTTKYGYIQVDENYRTSNRKVFAGGDVIGGISTVAAVSKTGREAAREIDKMLTNLSNRN